MVALQELNDDVGWTLVQSKKTQKERAKARQENMAAFPLLPYTQSNEELVTKLSKKSASSSKSSMKPKLSKIFNNNKLNKCSPKEVIIKTRTDFEQGIKTAKNHDEVISISSSDSDRI